MPAALHRGTEPATHQRPGTPGDRGLGASDSGAIPERFKSDSDLEGRFGKAGAWVSERFERDHCPLV